MPIGIDQWRAGIAFCKFQLISKVCFDLSFTGLLFSLWYCVAYLYLLIWSSVVTLPLSVMVTSLFSYFSPHTCWFNTFCFKVDELQDIVLNFIKISLYFLSGHHLLCPVLFNQLSDQQYACSYKISSAPETMYLFTAKCAAPDTNHAIYKLSSLWENIFAKSSAYVSR